MSEAVMIGSAAIAHWDKNLLRRQPADKDYLTVNPMPGVDSIDGRGILDRYCFSGPVASLNEVYTLKVSHSPWVVGGLGNWYKHLEDIKRLQSREIRLIPELHSAAYTEWEKRKGKKSVNLSRKAEEFFNNSVFRYYDHDSVHAAVALGRQPAFKSILRENSSVAVDRNKFESLSLAAKKRLVYEETMVLSLERDLIPMSFNRAVDKAAIYASYSKQLRLLITQYSKGWWPQWMIENFFLVHRPPLNYWSLFMDSDKKIQLDI